MHYIHRFKPKTIEKIVGGFVFLAIIFLLAIFFFVGQKKAFFEKEYRIHAVFDEGYGLFPGVVVKLAGMEVGKVESMDFNPENKIEVILRIREKFKEKIRQDSIVSIVREGLAGDKFLNISVGSPISPRIEEGEIIQARQIVEITDLAQKITPTLEYVEKISHNIYQVTERLASPSGELSVVLKNIKEITTELNEGKGSIGYLLKDDRKLYKDAEEAFGTTKKILSNLEMASQNLEKSAAQTPPAMTKVQETIEEAKMTIEEVKKLVVAAQKHWLLRGYLEDATRKKEESTPKKETPQPAEKK